MQIEIQEKRENKLLDRTDVRFIVHHDGEKTPAREQIKKSLASTLGAKPELTVVERLEAQFGRASSSGFAKVYKNLEQARAVERSYVQKRNGIYVEPKKREERKAGAA